MVKEKLKGKDQASCQDFKKKKKTYNRAVVFTEESSGSSP